MPLVRSDRICSVDYLEWWDVLPCPLPPAAHARARLSPSFPAGAIVREAALVNPLASCVGLALLLLSLGFSWWMLQSEKQPEPAPPADPSLKPRRGSDRRLSEYMSEETMAKVLSREPSDNALAPARVRRGEETPGCWGCLTPTVACMTLP